MLIKKLVPTLLRNNKYCKKLLYDKFVMLHGSIVRTGKLALILIRFINLKRKAKKRKEKYCLISIIAASPAYSFLTKTVNSDSLDETVATAREYDGSQGRYLPPRGGRPSMTPNQSIYSPRAPMPINMAQGNSHGLETIEKDQKKAKRLPSEMKFHPRFRRKTSFFHEKIRIPRIDPVFLNEQNTIVVKNGRPT